MENSTAEVAAIPVPPTPALPRRGGGRNAVPLALLVVLIAVASSARADDATAVHFVYFAAGSPGVVQVRASLDGKPIEPAWANAVDKFFDYLDRNGNGKLDEKERAILGQQSGRRRNEPIAAFAESDLAGRLKFDKNAELIDKPAFAEAVKASGFGPVGLQFQAARDDSAALTNALFKHLDANGDTKLSQEELLVARERLAFLDVNEDEWLTSQELTARAVTANRQLVQPGRRPQPEAAESNSNDFLLLNGLGLPAVKQLLAARGKPKATTLNRTELGVNEKSFAEFDRDANGSLDTDELMAWLNAKPMLTVTVDLAVDPTKASAKPNGVTMVSGTRFDVGSPASGGAAEWTATAYQVRVGFKALAKDGKVAKAALKDQPILAGAFGLLDRNSDDVLDEKEMEGVLSVLGQLAACRASISVVDQGRGLFELIDSNRDGQLSLRELAALPKVAKEFAGKDGSLAKADVPRLLAIRSTSAGIRMFSNPNQQDFAVDSSAMTAPIRSAPSSAGPPWFAKMDRNGDGDVSRKEFLGPLELFQKLDADGDGLISLEEAKKM